MTSLTGLHFLQTVFVVKDASISSNPISFLNSRKLSLALWDY